MAGRGFINEVEPIENTQLKVLRNGRWQKLYSPVNCDRRTSGISLAESFADAYQKEHNVEVGLIPCADGGTTLDQWRRGGLLYDHAVYQTRLAERTSTLAGILWHQGEGDCEDGLYQVYCKKLGAILDGFYEDLGLSDVPIIVGGLGDFLPLFGSGGLSKYTFVNDELKKLAAERANIGFASAEGLTANPDNLHFSAKALREFGLRYYEEFKKLENKNRVFYEKSSADDAVRTAMELL